MPGFVLVDFSVVLFGLGSVLTSIPAIGNDLPRVGMHAEIDQSTGSGAVRTAALHPAVAPHARMLED
jgi:hypothetical protein